MSNNFGFGFARRFGRAQFSLALFLLLPSLAACAGTSEASRSLSFDRQSDKAIVVVGTSVNRAQEKEVRSGRRLETYWAAYDPDTDRLIPGGETFVTTVRASLFSKPEYLEPTISVLEVEPGSYALIAAGFPHLMNTFVAEKKNSALTDERGRRQTWTFTVDPRRHIDPAAELDRQGNFLFSILPGEVLYIGHFEFLKWTHIDSFKSLNYFQDKAAALEALSDYPGISAGMTTLDPATRPQSVSREAP